jgi:hypothetical protein
MKPFKTSTDALQYAMFEVAYGRRPGPFCALLAGGGFTVVGKTDC